MKARKKWLIAVSILLVLFICCIYVFIPRTLTVSVYTKVNCTSGGTLRMINGSRFWEGLPKVLHSNETYRLTGNYFQRVTMIRQRSDGKEIDGSLKVVSLPWDDTVVLQWSGVVPTSLNPLTRVLQYREAKTTKGEMAHFLDELASYLGRKENIYGVNFNTGLVTDTEMVTTRWTRPAYPGTSDIYEKIGLLRSYIKSQGATETGYPMLNATRDKNDSFEIMVAIPVNRRLAGNTVITSKRFVSWKTFEGEVRGGPAVVEEAMKQLHNCVTDYRHTFMSIPFQSLVTDRNQEPDTLKWVTRVVQLVN